MRRLLHGRLGLKLTLGLALVAFSWFHFAKRFENLTTLARTIDRQNDEITKLNTTLERIQTLKSMQVDLRL